MITVNGADHCSMASIGLLIRLVRENIITVDETDAIHHHWITEEGFHSPVSSIADALDRLD